MTSKAVLLGNSLYQKSPGDVSCEYVSLDGEPYACIANVDQLDPFLMSVVSDGDLWLFVGSNTPFVAGRVEPNHGIFPYQTVDKILCNPDTSGACALFLVQGGGQWHLWEPWRPSGRVYRLSRNLYKHIHGTSVVFEEINHDLELRFRWILSACGQYGLARHSRFDNLRKNEVQVRYLDGWQNLMPPGVDTETFSRFSYLATGYMRHESVPAQALGIYTLNAAITDRAEACESLRATCAWSLGHRQPIVLLSTRQLPDFRHGAELQPEREVRGEMGAYLVADSATIAPGKAKTWYTIADTDLDHAAIVDLQAQLRNPAQLERAVSNGVKTNERNLRRLVAGADGLQDMADSSVGVHHFANVMFNCMRGGTFVDSYRFTAADFAAFLRSRNKKTHAKHQAWLDRLPKQLTLSQLHERVAQQPDANLTRLAHEYLPLTFSRRHGDPSRPWNRFAIRVRDQAGKPLYAYEGNWRDIFQNWESLAQSYPFYLEQMITLFLNASTADGYNPYRITREGIDWETLDPRDRWGHIGYWGDHQIIYLLRLLESYERFQPGQLAAHLQDCHYVYGHVPYEIAGFDELTKNPRETITYKFELHKELMARAQEVGGDGKLLAHTPGEPVLVSLAEKLLVPLLVKLSNLVPGGGIWLNTQRPEWNDANNALAGWGLSIVTVCYLRRYLAFCESLFAGESTVPVSAPVAAFLEELTGILQKPESDRFRLMSALGHAGQKHRQTIYRQGLDGQKSVSLGAIRHLITAALSVIDETIRTNRRADGLYNSYNVLHLGDRSADVQNLYPMLEGQVAVLSSGVLELTEVVALLQALRKSELYRPDQHSYILYPDRELPTFLARNTLKGPPPLADGSLFTKDNQGQWHFQADLRNAADISARLEKIKTDPPTAKAVLDLWEQTFRHSEFTGRSSTFFAFEGLGSIYWHMVAKLLLAVQECYAQATDPQIAQQLATAYDEIRDGLGFRKTPELYGAFPTDPYSHTPRHRGAQQPGMTGQVKEEILTRWGELGITIENGCLQFAPRLLHRSEFFTEPHSFTYIDVQGQDAAWEMPAGTLAFTYCQVPVCYRLAEKTSIEIERADGKRESHPANHLTLADSTSIFARDGQIARLTVCVAQADLRP